MPRITIRIKLLLLSIAMLSIPYVGFQYLRETERYLQSSLEDSLLAVAGALAVSLQNQSRLFQISLEKNQTAYPLFVHAFSYPIHVDGYTEDWANYLDWFDRFVASDQRPKTGRRGPAFDLVVGEYEQYLNLLIRVTDDSYVYQSGGSFQAGTADTVELVLYGENNEVQSVFFGTAGPGPVTAYSIIENWDFSVSRHSVNNVVGEWRESDEGYIVEIRIPRHLVNEAVGIVVHDRDANFDQSLKVSTTGSVVNVVPNMLLRTSAQLQQTIERVGLKKGRRVWVINHNGQVLASGGTLISEYKRGAINFLYTWLLPAASDSVENDLRSASRLRGKEVLMALRGKKSTRWRSSSDERAVIVSAAHPVRAGNELIGAVVVEETTNSIQTVQRDAMAALFNQSIVVFVGVSVVLLVFASRLSSRIAKLRDQSERAIDQHGRVVGTISGSSASDELGDLSRSFSAMVKRLADYNAYLESLASKLSHELRTPLTAVSSSLQNLEAVSSDQDQKPYLVRAMEGTDRLHGLVSRLSEAARLEQSIANVEFEEFDLSVLLRGCVEGYRNIYPSTEILLTLPLSDCPFTGSGDLIVQLMDKLIANAVSFNIANKPIEVALDSKPDALEIRVVNRGSSLPEAMQAQIFNSMVSLREERADKEPHLGLGLFISRLIVETHQGHIAARNLADASGVEFTVLLPNGDGFRVSS